MSDDISDGARLRARGASITLKDGPHQFVLDYEALEYIEELFDGLDEFLAAIRERAWSGKRLKNLRHGLVAGLLHEKPEEMDLDEFASSVRQRLDPRHMHEYIEGLLNALIESLPSAEGDEGPKAKGGNGSPGRGSTTSRRSNSVAVTASSGG